eukprot:7252702-Karenia_brevis.AAC.1
MIIDGRESSRLCRKPPHSWLGTVSALSQLDLSDSAVEYANGGVLESPIEVCGASADLVNGFYQFSNPQLGSLFGFDFPDKASFYGIDKVYDEQLRAFVSVAADDLVYPVFEGLPMGWSWVLYFCHAVTQNAGSSLPQSILVRDRSAIKTPSHAVAARSAYVDNANVIGVSRSTVREMHQRVLDDLNNSRLEYHEVVECSDVLELVGVVLDGPSRRLHHKPKRTWRLFYSIENLLKLKKVTGHVVQCVLGHIVNHFQLLRFGLAALGDIWSFVSECYHTPTVLWDRVRWELNVCKWLVFLAE